jgi:hypothetical protein
MATAWIARATDLAQGLDGLMALYVVIAVATTLAIVGTGRFGFVVGCTHFK